MVENMEELMYTIALTMVPQIGSIQSRILLDQLVTAKAVFQAPASRLERISGIGPVRARAIRTFHDFRKAEKECRTMERLQIRPLLYNSKEYPHRLKNCPDPPPLLFYKGTADLQAARIIAMVGTRKETDYGREMVQVYVEALQGLPVVVVSGLAYGIDQCTHQACVEKKIPTVGVLAHGLDKIYPSSHYMLARKMENSGGLLTEFCTGTQPDRQNFPRRNRIVAGICDAVLVVETDIKGGSMITAEIANGYHREVFAIPGKIADEKSQGCNYLIRENRARLTMHPSDLLQFMNWEESPRPASEALFTSADPDQQLVLGILQQYSSLHVDQLKDMSGLPHSRIAAALLGLEMEKRVTPLPGKVYRLQTAAQGQNLLRI